MNDEQYRWNLKQLLEHLNELATKHGDDLPCEIQGHEGEIYPMTEIWDAMEMDGVIHIVLSAIPPCEPAPRPA